MGNVVARSLGIAALALAVGAGCKGSSKQEPPPPSSTEQKPAASVGTPAGDAGRPGVNDVPLDPAAIAAVVNPGNVPAYEGPTGSVEGTLFVTGDEPPEVLQDFAKCPEAAETYGKLFRVGSPVDGGARPVADGIVGVADYQGFVPEKREAKLVTIERCAFNPPVITLTFGQRLEVQNRSDAYHAPVIEQQATPALMVAPPNGDPVKLYPKLAGHLTMADRMSPPVRAELWVLRQPLHATTDRAGHYRINGIPVGKATLFARLPPIHRETSQSIDVLAGVVSRVDLKLHFDRKTIEMDGGRDAAAR